MTSILSSCSTFRKYNGSHDYSNYKLNVVSFHDFFRSLTEIIEYYGEYLVQLGEFYESITMVLSSVYITCINIYRFIIEVNEWLLSLSTGV